MRYVLFALLALHGVIHALGAVKAFGLAELPALRVPISRAMGSVWLFAGVLVLASAVVLLLTPVRGGWALGLVACVVSELVIASAWRDAKFGTLPNVLLLLTAVCAFALNGPTSLRAEFEEDRQRAPSGPGPLLTDALLAPLPPAVQAYLRYTGSVGKPVPRSFSARMRGRIRGGPDKPWMDIDAEQRNLVVPTSRLFFLRASMFGLPVAGYHRLADETATMRIRLLGLVPVVNQAGRAFYDTELVTVFNDLCVLAPGALVDPRIGWKELDAHRVEASFLGHRSVLVFDAEGKLVNFWSDERPALSGGRLVPMRWSTPLSAYRRFGDVRLASHGEARYASPSGDYAYIELAIEDVRWD